MRSRRPWVNKESSTEAGQSVVLIALVFVILLLFVGLALDAGLAFVQSSQFSRAVDSAVLAGAVDLFPNSSVITSTVPITDTADASACQLLRTYGMDPCPSPQFESSISYTGIGIPQYSLTVTWPVSPFFIRLIGIDAFPITHSATAAFHTNAEMYTPTAYDDGQMRRAAQFVFGPDGCTWEGDPVSPLNTTPGQTNVEYSFYEGLYRYRISIPPTYTESELRVELFDTDSVNLRGNSATINHTLAVSNTLGMTSSLSCDGAGMGERCIISTGEDLVSELQNPFWFQRVDETWRDNQNNCNPDQSNPNGDTVTEYELFYFDDQGDRQSLGLYVEDNTQTGATDMNWVTPGVTISADAGSFQPDISGLPQDDAGFRHLYLDVETTSGASKNVWDIWAGPKPDYYTNQGLAPLSDDLNDRNVQLANSPFVYQRLGISVLALGRMPLDNYLEGTNSVDFPFSPLDIGAGGNTIFASVFDYDLTVANPIFNFQIDTVPTNDFDKCADVVSTPTTGSSGDCGSDHLQASCNNGIDCDNVWMRPHFAMEIPGESSGYFGGDLIVNDYSPGGDAHTWSLAITGERPFLTR